MSGPRVSYVGYVQILVHRVLAGHRSGEMCPACPALCEHCGNVGPAGADHRHEQQADR